MYLEEISDDQLIYLCREGYQVAYDLLYERYTKFLYGIINSVFHCKRGYIEYSDLFQDSFTVFLRCLELYDEEEGCFYFFVKRAVERKLFKKYKEMKNNDQILSLDDEYYESEEKIIDYVAEDSEEYNVMDKIQENLSENSYKILKLKYEGYSYKEIASILKIKEQQVYRSVIEIKNIVKDIIEKID